MSNFITRLFHPTLHHVERLAESMVVPEEGRCVQCGICSYNCPAGIDIRWHSAHGVPVQDARCLTCGECVQRCPRGVLHFAQNTLVDLGKES
jgi:heterodisulfide reductase subunit C